MLEVSRSRRSMSLTSPSLEDGVSWVLEVEISKSLPLTGLLAPSFFAKALEGEGRGCHVSVMGREVSLALMDVTFLSPHTPEAPSQLSSYLKHIPRPKGKEYDPKPCRWGGGREHFPPFYQSKEPSLPQSRQETPGKNGPSVGVKACRPVGWATGSQE